VTAAEPVHHRHPVARPLALLPTSVVVAALFDDPQLLLVKDSALTGLLGLVFLGSPLAPRPLTFFFGRKFATSGNPDRIAWWNGLWQFPAFRRAQRVPTVVWGLAYLGEALLRIALSFVLPVPAMVAVNTVLPLVVTALLIAGTVLDGRRARAAATHRRAVEPADTTTPAALHDARLHRSSDPRNYTGNATMTR